MVREIVKDEDKLRKSLKRVDKSEGKLVKNIIQDLIDTAEDFGEEWQQSLYSMKSTIQMEF